MRFSRLAYLCVALLPTLLFSRIVPAQAQLAQLPADKNIRKGSLPCGLTYYMASAPEKKGYAHIALVQRDSPLSESKREALSSAFLGRMGIAPGADGFVSDVDGSTVYHFYDVPVYRPQVLDSTLLYSFSQVAASHAEQAIIVSGDIDPVELKKKMDMLSMMVPRMLVRENHNPDYVWEPSPAPSVLFWADGTTSVSVTYESARIPYQSMNTAQALVTELFGTELGVLVQHRLERNLNDAGIPFAGLEFKTQQSTVQGADERYTVRVNVPRNRQNEAMRVIAATLGELDSFGASPAEFGEAKQVMGPGLQQRAATRPSSEAYLDKCICNFLYGSQLSPDSELLRYFSRKNVADSTETRFFNEFTGDLLEQLSNLTLEYTGTPDSLDRDDALFYYNLDYLYGSVGPSGKDYRWHSADSVAFQWKIPKVRLKSEKPEVVTGGTIWTFSNGMRVIFKQVQGSGTFSYAVQLNGGLADVDGLKEGEGGYIGPILSTYDVAGIPASAFRDLLASNGISLAADVQLNGMSLRGSAPSDRLSLVLKALLGVTTYRSVNEEAFRRLCASASLETPPPTAALYRKLNPGYVYTTVPIPEALSEESLTKADAYFNERFTRMKDGVVILCGDLSPEAAKKQLSRYLGGFQTVPGNIVRRHVDMPTLSGVTTYTADSGTPGIHILMDADYTLTAAHYYTALVAAEALQKTLIDHLAGSAYTPEVSLRYTVHPEERFQLLVSCLPVDRQSLPSDVDPQSAEQTLTTLRAAIRNAALTPVEPVDLQAWKAGVEHRVTQQLSTPEGFTSTLLSRYAASKDLTSSYKDAIAAVSSAQIQTFLGALADGGRIEYLVL